MRHLTRIGFLLLGVTLGAATMLLYLDHVQASPLTVAPCPSPKPHRR